MSSAGASPEIPRLDTRSGYVTLVGRPNAGKSTLLNALVGERLSIVTPKAQTTWQRVTGIATTDGVQMIFLDTPGLLEPRDLLQEAMVASAADALAEADVILLVLDAADPRALEGRGVMENALRKASGAPLVGAVNKIDRAKEPVADALSAWVEGELAGEAYRISALQEEGIDELRDRLGELLPPGPYLYPPEDIARDPVRFFVAEMIRETVFQMYRQEIPYSVFCRVEEFRESQDPVYIQAHIFVERKSQKGILVGKGGSSIRTLGAKARSKIEDFLQERVYLDLWVKVLPNWRRKRAELKRLGFPVPDATPGHEHP